MRKLLNHLNKVLSQMHFVFQLILIVILILLLGLLDFYLGHNFDLSLFYLVPIFIITWFNKKIYAVAISFITALTWGFVDWLLIGTPKHIAVVLWNTFVDFGFYFIVVIILLRIKKQNHELERLSILDPLTGILNRRIFSSNIEKEIERCKRNKSSLSIAYIDVDNFKSVNDNFGHKSGDTVLQETAKILRENIRINDTAARLGGDEFALLFPGTNQEDVKQIIDKLKKQLRNIVDEEKNIVTYSIGVVTVLKPVYTVDEIINKADKTMYLIKNDGKNNVLFEMWP